MRSLIALYALALGACAAETSSPAVADHFEVLAGGAQTGAYGRALDSLIVVRLVDDRGAPMVGVPVRWSVITGGGRLDPVTAVTGPDGLAMGRWIMGSTPEDPRLQVSAAGLPPLDIVAQVAVLRATAVAVSGSAACVLDPLGAAWCWGYHQWYQATPNATYGPVPIKIDSTHTFRTIAGGIDHFCALTTAGEAWCWGIGSRGELGTGAAVTSTLTPVAVAGGHTFTSITASWYTTCAIDTAGQAWCWGTPGDGSLGTAAYTELSPAPVQQGATVFTSISMAYEHICALETGGQAWCWGHQDVGQLGDSIGGSATTPRQVQGPTRYREIAAGDHFTCAIGLEGGLWCWGSPPLAPYQQSQRPVAMGVTGLRGLMGDDSFLVGLSAGRPLSAGSSWYTGAPEALGGGTLKAMPGGLFGISQIALRWSTICMLRSDQAVLCAGDVPGYGSSATPVAIPAP